MSITRKRVSDLVGFAVGRLTVQEYLGKGKFNKHYWRCSCSCGGEVILNTSRITGASATKSCGCLRKEELHKNRKDPTRHGLHKHKLYGVYSAMVYRCSNPNAQRWKYYGGKGVRVCPEWQDFLVFYNWAISNGYEEGLSIDRVDPDGDYSPANCRWITVNENTRRAHAGNTRGKV